MSLSIGIVGLPNVGKSTLFNAITAAGAEAANYPFCTIEPNVGVVDLPDPRLDKLTEILNPPKVVPAAVKFVDIAGLVKGASRGEGLGNKFLGNIRETDAIAHVVRCFSGDDTVHVTGEVDPAADMATVNLELIFADLETVQNRLERTSRAARAGQADAKAETDLLNRVREWLEEGRPARTLEFDEDDMAIMRHLHLLTMKPVMYVANVAEDDLAEAVKDPDAHPLVGTLRKAAAEEGAQVLIVSAAIEAELMDFPPEERAAYLEELGLPEPGLNRVIRAGFALLGLITYFTFATRELRAWTIKKGTKAPQAAGVIHTDFERGFIRAEVTGYDDLVAAGSREAAREQGLVRLEGKDYIIQDGDFCLFRFNV